MTGQRQNSDPQLGGQFQYGIEMVTHLAQAAFRYRLVGVALHALFVDPLIRITRTAKSGQARTKDTA